MKISANRAQTLRGVYEKTQPVLAVAACAAAGFLISGAQIFGTLRPFGIAFAACVNAPYALAAAGCFVVSSVITILDGGGASDVIYAAGQALIICALAYLMHPAAGVSGILSSAKTDAESRASLLTVLVVAVCSLAPYSFGLIRPAYILGAAAVLLSVYSAREYGAALSGAAVCAAIAISGGDGIFAGLGFLFGGVAAGFATTETRGVTAIIMCAASAAALPFAEDAPTALSYVLCVCTDTFGVQRGDMLVLVSDGAICGDADWLLEKLSGIKQKAPQDIAGAIVAAAKAKTARPDDITAVCVRFEAA